MDQAYHTRELAKAYETQGYYRQALDIYSRLDRENTDVQAECRRLETLLAETEPMNSETRLTALIEDWVKLWWTSHHLTAMDHLMSQARSKK